MKFRTAIRPLVPHFLRCVYYQRLLSRLSAEPDALRCRSFVKLGDCVIDVGANIGTYTRILSQWVGPEGSVHSYEPVPETFSYLCNNVTKFGMANVIVHNAAASSQHGEGKMHVPNSNFYRARLSSDGDFVEKAVANQQDTQQRTNEMISRGRVSLAAHCDLCFSGRIPGSGFFHIATIIQRNLGKQALADNRARGLLDDVFR